MRVLMEQQCGVIVLLDPKQIFPSDNNPNRLSPDKFEMLVGAIRRFGFLSPILVRERKDGVGHIVVDGHHRLRAAQEIGLTEIPAVVINKDEAESDALQIGMNRLRGDLDLTATAQILDRLRVDEGWTDEELSVLGFTEDELTALLSDELLADEIPGSMEIPSSDENENPLPFVLELEFETREDLKEAKRKLKKAAGAAGSLAAGLLNVLRGEQ